MSCNVSCNYSYMSLYHLRKKRKRKEKNQIKENQNQNQEFKHTIIEKYYLKSKKERESFTITIAGQSL